MAWNNVTYKCGCTIRENLYGSYESRDYHIARCAERFCPDCARQQQNEISKSFSEENNLIDLQGSEKQIAWANTIRMNVYKLIQEILPKVTKNQDIFNNLINTHIFSNNQAKWWIENRYELGTERSLMMYLQSKINN